MTNPYYIFYAPPTFDLRGRFGKNAGHFGENNFLEYLRFDRGHQRKNMSDTLAMECYTLG